MRWKWIMKEISNVFFLIQKSTHKIWIKEQIIENRWYLKKKNTPVCRPSWFKSEKQCHLDWLDSCWFFFSINFFSGIKSSYIHNWFICATWLKWRWRSRAQKAINGKEEGKKVVLWPTWNNRTQNKYTKNFLIRNCVHTAIEIVK